MDVYLDDSFRFPFCKVLHSVDGCSSNKRKTLEETTREKKTGKYVTLVIHRLLLHITFWIQAMRHPEIHSDCVFFLKVDLYRYSYIDEHAKKHQVSPQ